MAGLKHIYRKSGVYAYLINTADTTTPSTPNEFTPILGTFTNDPINDFSLGTDAIVYDGINGVYFEIDWHASFQLNSANKTVHFGISINGETLSIESKGVVGTFAKNNGQAYSVSGTQVVMLDKNDTIQLQLTCSVGSSVVTVNHFTTTVRKFYDN